MLITRETKLKIVKMHLVEGVTLRELSELQIPQKQHADSERAACCSALRGTE